MENAPSVYFGGASVNLEPNTEEETALVMDLIMSTDKVLLYESIAASLITDEVNRYLAGQCTAEQAADAIESRVTIYLSEIS